MIRFVAVLDQRDLVVKTYSIEIPDHLVESEEAFIVAARRLASRDELEANGKLLRFLIAPTPNLPG